MPYQPTYPVLLDEVKTLPLSKLKDWGYLEPNCVKSGKITWSVRGEEIGSIRIRGNMRVENPYIQLLYNYREEPVQYKVPLVTVPSNLGLGKLWYFLCPETNKRCRKLYGAGKYFLHREAYPYAMYEKQTYSKRQRLFDQVLGGYFEIDDLYQEIFSKHFKTHYAGKPTKRYKQILRRLEKAKSLEGKALKLLEQ